MNLIDNFGERRMAGSVRLVLSPCNWEGFHDSRRSSRDTDVYGSFGTVRTVSITIQRIFQLTGNKCVDFSVAQWSVPEVKGLIPRELTVPKRQQFG